MPLIHCRKGGDKSDRSTTVVVLQSQIAPNHMQALQALKASADTLFHIQQKAQVILWRRNLQSTCKIRRFWRHDPTLQDWNQSPPDRGEAGCRQPESHGQRKEPTEQPVCGLEELPEQVPNSFPPPLLWKRHFSKSKDFIQSLFQGTILGALTDQTVPMALGLRLSPSALSLTPSMLGYTSHSFTWPWVSLPRCSWLCESGSQSPGPALVGRPTIVDNLWCQLSQATTQQYRSRWRSFLKG